MHYHYIGEGLSTSEANFRAALDIAREKQDRLWIAGMANIHKYDTERRSATIEIENKSERRIVLHISCSTKAELYDQPLTIDAALPDSWARQRVVVTKRDAQEIDVRRVSTPAGVVLRFDVSPIDAEFAIEKTGRAD